MKEPYESCLTCVNNTLVDPINANMKYLGELAEKCFTPGGMGRCKNYLWGHNIEILR